MSTRVSYTDYIISTHNVFMTKIHILSNTGSNNSFMGVSSYPWMHQLWGFHQSSAGFTNWGPRTGGFHDVCWQVEQDVSLNSMKSIPEIFESQTLVWFITEHTMYGTSKSKIKNTAYIYWDIAISSLGLFCFKSHFAVLTYVYQTWGLYSLKRKHLTGIGIPMINLRQSDDRLRFIMGILIPTRQCLLIEWRPSWWWTDTQWHGLLTMRASRIHW